MNDHAPYIGIDFGTTNSSMAWFDPRTGQAEIILNAEGEAKTPSVVYFGEGETLVGKQVDELIEDVAVDHAQREEVFRRTVMSIKRNLINPPRIALPDGRYVRPVEVAAEVLKKVKRDAEVGHFHEEIERAVITCPAEFNVLQRRRIEEAGRLAGFGEVVMLEEPVAGALAYARGGLNVGTHVLVYDLGGGTFDLAVLENEEESFRVALEPKGMDRSGGDDFDLALYYHCDEIAREELGRSISLSGDIDKKFLRLCRRRKENLSWQEQARFSSYLASDNGAVKFTHEIDRNTFEDLIDPYIETTLQLTEQILEEAGAKGHNVDTVVLIGGSSRVPMVLRRLDETLPVNPLGFDKKDVAVALGAAHYTNVRWPARRAAPVPSPPPESTPLDRYREAVEAARAEGRLDKAKADRLDVLAGQLGLVEEQVSDVERRVLGDSKEGILVQEEYRRAVEMVWADGKLSGLEAEWLGALAGEMGLDPDRTESVEREVMGAAKETIASQTKEPEPPEEPGAFDLAFTLTGHSDAVHSVAFSSDGQFLASGGSDHGVRGWNARAGQSVGALAGRLGRVRSVAFSPDGMLLAGGGFDRTIRVWKLPRGEPLHTLDHSEWVFCVAVSPDNRTLASGGADKEIKQWDLETGKLLRTLTGHSHWVLSVAFSPDGRLLISSGADKTIRVQNPETGEPIHTFEHTDRVWSVVIGPDGDLIAGGGEDGAIGVWDANTGELLRTIAAHSAPVLSIAWSTDGQLLFSGGADRKIKVWNPRTGELLNILSGHSKGVGSVAVSYDGQLLASGSHDRTIKIWRKEVIEESSAPIPKEESSLRTSSPPDKPEPVPERPQYLPD